MYSRIRFTLQLFVSVTMFRNNKNSQPSNINSQWKTYKEIAFKRVLRNLQDTTMIILSVIMFRQVQCNVRVKKIKVNLVEFVLLNKTTLQLQEVKNENFFLFQWKDVAITFSRS